MILMCVLAAASISLGRPWRNVWFGPTIPVDHQRAEQAEEFIDPNTAPAASLLHLPGIGPVKATAIVAYRQGKTLPAFRRPEDLEQVNGIGPKTREAFEDYLVFPPASQPAN